MATEFPRRLRFSEASSFGLIGLAVAMVPVANYAIGVSAGWVTGLGFLESAGFFVGSIAAGIVAGVLFRIRSLVDFDSEQIARRRYFWCFPAGQRRVDRFREIGQVVYSTDADGNDTATLRFADGDEFLVMSYEGLKAVHLVEKFRDLPASERVVASQRSRKWGRR